KITGFIVCSGVRCKARVAPRRMRGGAARSNLLASRKFRLTLFHERGDAFFVVARAAEGALRVTLDIELIGERPRGAFADELLSRRQTLCRRRSESGGERVCFFAQLIVI